MGEKNTAVIEETAPVIVDAQPKKIKSKKKVVAKTETETETAPEKTKTSKKNKKDSKLSKDCSVEYNDRGVRGMVFGFPISQFLKGLGAKGFKAKQARIVLDKLGLKMVSNSTVSCQVGAGRQIAAGEEPHHKGEAAKLSKDIVRKCKEMLPKE